MNKAEQSGGGFILDTPKQIQLFYYLAQLHALGLQMCGIRVNRGVAASTFIRKTYGLRGSNKVLYGRFQKYITEKTGHAFKDQEAES